MGMIHLRHLHENLDLTFGEIKSIMTDVAAGDIEMVEKFDGQSIFFTWDAGSNQVKAAYSEPELRSGGASPEEFTARWKGHPAELSLIHI